MGHAHESSPTPGGFHLPPPLIYAIPLAGTLLLHRWHPVGLLPHAVATPVGAVLLTFGLIGIPAILRFRRAGTSPLPWRQASALVTDGPYRFTRNPMYVGLTMLYLGATALANSAWPLAALPVVIALMHFLVIRGEEARLEAQFGAAYRDYCARVRRWL